MNRGSFSLSNLTLTLLTLDENLANSYLSNSRGYSSTESSSQLIGTMDGRERGRGGEGEAWSLLGLPEGRERVYEGVW